ncbi:MAG TPA: FG-GAP-like repeat-containing protein [Casimicrobiaceae bacterium]|nr:FG-GAP-like repeat-containing protein [Casimicrobiaceae bacterium]
MSTLPPSPFGAAGNLTLQAVASSPGNGCDIKQVDFVSQSEGKTYSSLGTNLPLYTYSPWGVPGPGTYVFTARAKDERGVTTTSAPLTLTACAPPTINFVSPSPPPGAQILAPVTVAATGSVAAGCGPLTTFLFNGNNLLASSSGSAVSVTVSPPAGAYAVRARAQDGAGQATDATLSFTVVAPGSNLPPAISSIQPASTSASPGTPVTFNVVATDANTGDNLTIQLLNGATELGKVVHVAPANVALQWTPSATGDYTLTVKVTDSGGLSTSQNVTVSVVSIPVSPPPAADQVIPVVYPTPGIGTVAGSFSVGDNGAASYSIPIPVPPGTAGMQPNLALVYSSQSGNGHLGVGWSLSGLSMIARCPKTELQDGTRQAINYNNADDDAFCLDGQRLVLVNGGTSLVDTNYSTATFPNGISAIKYEYRTELDSFARIEAYQEADQTNGNLLVGPYRFRVWTKSGQVMDYGSRWWIVTAGWTQSNGRNGVLQQRKNVGKTWVLDRVIDRSGNFMEIDYADRAYEAGPADPAYGLNLIRLYGNCSQSPGGSLSSSQSTPIPIGALPSVEYWVTSIRYYASDAPASDCGSGTNNQVSFVYEDMPGQASGPARDRYYDSGQGQSSLSKRLVEIRASADGLGVAEGTISTRFGLAYTASQQTGRSLLQSVTRYGSDGVALPATLFAWAANDSATGWNATGRTFAQSSVVVPFGINPSNQGDPGVMVGDWNGDGLSDLLGWRTRPHPFLPGWYVHELVVCLANGAGFTCGSNGVFNSSATRVVDQDSSAFYGSGTLQLELLDANNDGKVDLAWSDSSGNWTLCLSDGQFACTPAAGTWKTSKPNGPTFRGDFDGDGRIDVVTYLGNAVYEVCLNRDTGFACYQQNLNSQVANGLPAYPYTPCSAAEGSGCEAFTDSNVQYQVLVADVNGDGKADLIRRRSDSDLEDRWKACFSDFGPGTSNSFVCHDRFIQAAKGRVDNTVLYDFNGDGIADLASTEGGVNQWRVCLSTGDGAFEFRDPYVHWDPGYVDPVTGVHGAYVDASGTAVSYYDSTVTPRCRVWNGTGASGNTKVIYGDFNGDGRTDVASWNSSSRAWTVCMSTGSDFACANWAGPVIGKSNPDLNQWVLTGDFDGDGKTDLICLAGGCNGQLGLSAGPRFGDVLTKITTGLGATTQVTYAPLTDGSVYSKGAGAAPTQRELDVQSPLYVVKHTDESNGIGGFFKNDYFYENLRGRTDGRGLYGFFKKRVRDGNNIVTETEYLRVAASSYPSNWAVVGRPSVVRKYAPNPATFVADISQSSAFTGGTTLFGTSLRLVNRSTNSWEMRSSSSCGSVCGGAPVIVTSNLSQSVDESWELDGSALPTMTTTTPFAFVDAYGNPQQVTVTSSDGYIKDTVNTYQNDAGPRWLPGRLTRADATLTHPRFGAVKRVAAFTYQGMNGTCTGAAAGQSCDEIVEPDFVNDSATAYSLWQQTSYRYDSYGNRVATTVQFKDRAGTLNSRATTTQFGYNGRFATLVTNALNQSESRQFDTRWGLMVMLQGPNGVVTNNLYDGFGRKYGERILDASGNRLKETFAPTETSGLTGFERYRTRALVSGGAETQTYFDELQRETRTAAKAFNAGTYAQVSTAYDSLGRKSATSKPAGAGTITTTYSSYDPLNRPLTEQTTGSGLSLTTTYAYKAITTATGLTIDGASVGGGLYTTLTQTGTGIASRAIVKYVNSQGQTVRVTDGENGSTDFVFDSYGNLIKTIGPAGIAEQLSYDRRGRKIGLASADSGAWSYEYDGIGQLVRQTDAKGQVTRMFYDAIGRVVERREHPGGESTTPFVTISSFDAYADGTGCAYGIGKLCEVRTATAARTSVGGALVNPETRRVSTFDAAGRPFKDTTQVDGRSFDHVTTFDVNGRVDKLVYPSGYIVVHRYTPWSGVLDQVAEWRGTSTGAVHWQANSRFADGQIQSMQVGSAATTKGYDGFGRVASISTSGGTQAASYAFDALGNLTSRNGPESGGSAQTFAYDRVNRLTNFAGLTASYSADGNISVKAGSTYAYVPGTHRLSSAAGNSYAGYDANGNVGTITNAGVTRALTYAPFNLPSTIAGPGGTLAYVYDGAHARIKETSAGAASSGTTYYLGDYEEHLRAGDAVLEQRHYLGTPEGVIGLYTARSNGANDLRYWHKDHLGSVVVITDAVGTVKQSFAYDAWGNRTQTVLATGEPYAEERGYTGHEQLVEVGLVHMNGRIYDPGVGRFLEADPIVQDPLNGQSYNRYAYVLNNPLSFTDPTGFSWWTKWRKPLLAIAAAATLQWYVPSALLADLAPFEVTTEAFSSANFVGAVAGGFAAGGIQGGNIESALQGAVFASLNFGIGALTGHTPAFGTNEFAANVALHAGLGCGQQAAAGGSCRGGALSGGFSAFAGPLIQGPYAVQLAGHAAIGAAASRLAGDQATNGAVTAAFGYLFNEAAGASASPGADLPPAPQWVVDFAAGFGDNLSFGITRWIRDRFDIGSVDRTSGPYFAGEMVGMAESTFLGGALGLRLAGTAGPGVEFSHWIPNRWGGPRSLLNGNFVTDVEHALSDPYRYRFMDRAWKALNPMPTMLVQQWNRIPWLWKGSGGGAGYGAASVWGN